MTPAEKAALQKILEDAPTVKLPGTSYTFDDGKMRIEELMAHAKRQRLWASEDFKKGWELCSQSIVPMLQFVLEGSNEDLWRYVGGRKKERRKGR
jgi:hypothetical protein